MRRCDGKSGVVVCIYREGGLGFRSCRGCWSENRRFRDRRSPTEGQKPGRTHLALSRELQPNISTELTMLLKTLLATAAAGIAEGVYNIPLTTSFHASGETSTTPT